MSGTEIEPSLSTSRSGGADLYCLGTVVADEASRQGFREFAKAMEAALNSLLAELPREEQWRALRLSYEVMVGGDDAAPPRLRLAYSRD